MQGVFSLFNTKTSEELIFYTRNHNKYWEIVKEKAERPETTADPKYIKDLRNLPKGTFELNILERIDGSEATVSNELLQTRKAYWIAKRNPAYNGVDEKRKARVSTIGSLESRITVLEQQVARIIRSIEG